MELKTSKLLLSFDPVVGNFTKIENLRTGENYIKEIPRDPLVDLFGLLNSEITKLSPCKADVTISDHQLQLHYASFGGQPIQMDLVCDCDDDKVTIYGNVQNSSSIDVVQILMPHIGGLYLGGSADDFLIYPHHAG